MAAVLVAAFAKSLDWNASLVAVLVAVCVLARVRAVPGVAEAKLTVMVVVASEADDDARKTPETWKGAETVEEAAEINPPERREKPETARLVVVALVEVELTVVRLVIVEVALLTRIPPERVERPEAVRREVEARFATLRIVVVE